MNSPLDLERETSLHDIHSRCSSLKSAAEMIENLPANEADELLDLMAGQVQRLVRNIADYRQKRGQRR